MREATLKPVIIAILIMLFIVLLPLLVIVVPTAVFLGKPKKRTAEEVADFLKRARSGTLAQEEWDRFTKKRIRDEGLDAIRLRAAIAGPPQPDRLMLRQLEREALKLGAIG